MPDCSCIRGHRWSDFDGHEVSVIVVYDFDCDDWEHAVIGRSLHLPTNRGTLSP